jgi:LacI family transcriptional regulator
MAKAVKLEDIAKRIGVSNVTVSKALADKEGVSAELRSKIKELAQELGYKVKKSDQSIESGVKGDIGIVIPARFVDKNSSFYWDMYERLISWLTHYGFYGILEILQSSDEEELEQPRLVKDGKVQGLIVMGQVNRDYMEMIYGSELPVIFLDAYNSYTGCDAIISDGYYGMYTMTNYLLEKGHRDISFVGTPGSTSSISDRYFGYMRAMMEKGIEVTTNMIVPDREMGSGVIRIYLPDKIPSAFACNCDSTAYELILALKEKGYRIPEDVSVVGFDNFMVSEISVPKITTYEVDVNGMAKVCAERLIKKINNRSNKLGLKIIVGKIIVRDSVKDVN